MGIIISIGRWGGVWVSLSTWAKRICLGWLAITYVPTDGDDVLKAASDWNAGYKELVNARTEIDRLQAALAAADGIRIQLGYFMESDSCENDPNFSWPGCDCEGCSYCSAAEDMSAYDVAMAAVQDAPRDGE